MSPDQAPRIQRDDGHAGAPKGVCEVVRRVRPQHGPVQRRRHVLQHGAAGQQRHRRRRERRHEVPEVLGHARLVAADLRGLGAGEREGERGGPPLGAPDDAADLRIGQRDARPAREAGGGRLVEGEVVRAEAQQPPLGGEPSERHRRGRAARDHHLRPRRQAADRPRHQARDVARDEAGVVQDEHHRLRAPGHRRGDGLGHRGPDAGLRVDPREGARIGVRPVRQERRLAVARRGLDDDERDVRRGDQPFHQRGTDDVARTACPGGACTPRRARPIGTTWAVLLMAAR